MDAAFGPARARALADDLVLSSLGGHSPRAALAAGVPTSAVWRAVCDAMDLDDDARWHHREDPKRRRA